jgi:hypothetical protein
VLVPAIMFENEILGSLGATSLPDRQCSNICLGRLSAVAIGKLRQSDCLPRSSLLAS